MKRKMIQINGKRKQLHRHILEQHLNHSLTINEIVHHKDGNIKNNNIENLEIMSREEHTSLHLSGRKK